MIKTSPFFEKIYSNEGYNSPVERPLPKAPEIIDIELTNQCNMACLFCDRQSMKRDGGYMNESTFKKIADESSEIGVKGLRFIRWGEPYLNPKIFDFIRYSKEKGLLVHITTNGKLMDKNIAKKTIESGLDHLIFSFQGTDKKRYQEMRGENYNLFEKNVKGFMKTREELLRANPFVQITTSTTNESYLQIEKFKQKWGEIVDLVTHTGTTSFHRVKDKEKVKRSGILEKATDWDREKTCYEVFKKLAINWNGDITACANDFDEFLILGNIKEDGIEETWKSKQLTRIREILKRNNKKEINKKIPFCGYCRNRF